MVRIFIAIDLPPEIREQVRECQKILSKTNAKLTLVNPSITHITLKFIGEMPTPRIDPIVQALSTLRFTSFPFDVSGIGANNPRAPRVIWANVKDGGRCADLHRDIEEILTPLDIPRDGRPFTPHATLARVRSFHPSLLSALQTLRDQTLGTTEARCVRLKKSILQPSGPVYEDLVEVACL